MVSEINRERYERHRTSVMAYESGLMRGLPPILGPMLGSKGNYKAQDIPDYDYVMAMKNKQETYSPVTHTRYDSAHEKDQFVDYHWWKKPNKDIIAKTANASEVEIGGAKALDYQKHLDELDDQLTQEDVDGLDQS